MINQAGSDVLDDEVGKIQKWRDKANSNMKSLQKRSALAFLGLSPDASEDDINKMYSGMAVRTIPPCLKSEICLETCLIGLQVTYYKNVEKWTGLLTNLGRHHDKQCVS